MRTVQIAIPDWVPTKAEIRYAYNTLKYKLMPDRCKCCGARVDFRGNEFAGVSHGKRILIAHNMTDRRSLCGNCLAAKVRGYFSQAYIRTDKCDCCEEIKPVVYAIPGIFEPQMDDAEQNYNRSQAYRYGIDQVILGMSWWNGFRLCKDCITDVLTESGTARSSHLAQVRGKVYYVNHRGALISPKEPMSISFKGML